MKQLFLSLLFLFVMGAQVYAVDIPKAVLKTFNKMYPDVENEDVDWDHYEEDEIYVAFFDNGNYESEAHFKEDGNWLKTSTSVGVIDLPEKLMNYFAEEYPDVEDFIASIKEERPSGVQFFISFEYDEEEYTFIFDESGNRVDF